MLRVQWTDSCSSFDQWNFFFTLPNASEGCKLKEKPFTARKLNFFLFVGFAVSYLASPPDKNWINSLVGICRLQKFNKISHNKKSEFKKFHARERKMGEISIHTQLTNRTHCAAGHSEIGKLKCFISFQMNFTRTREKKLCFGQLEAWREIENCLWNGKVRPATFTGLRFDSASLCINFI